MIREFTIHNEKEIPIIFENENIEVILFHDGKHSRLFLYLTLETDNSKFLNSLLSLSNLELPTDLNEELLEPYLQEGRIETISENKYKIKWFPIWDILDEELKISIKEKKHKLMDLGKKILKSLFWRYQLLALPNPIAVSNLQVSLDNRKTWFDFHMGMRVSIDVGQGIFFTPKIISELRELIKNKKEKFAIGFELWREAWVNRNKNRRSSWLLAISALEASAVVYVSTFYPEAGWLISELPKPYLIKIYNKYFPTLVKNKHSVQFFPLHRDINRILQNGIDKRNDITHTGEGIHSSDDLELLLNTCKDLLYIVDYHFGNEWALHYVSDTTKQKYGIAATPE